MTDKEEPNRVLVRIQLLLRFRWKRRLVSEKQMWIKTMVNGNHSLSCPALQLVCKGLGRGHGAIGPQNGSPSHRCPGTRVKPHRVLAPVAQIAAEILRGIKRIAAQQNLRHGDFTH